MTYYDTEENKHEIAQHMDKEQNESKWSVFPSPKWTEIKNEIIEAPKWVVSIDDHDIELLFDGDETFVQIGEGILDNDDSANRLEKVLQLATSDYEDSHLVSIADSDKMLIAIFFPLSSPITMEEMKYVQSWVDHNLSPEVECIWGLAPRQDNKLRAVVAGK